MASYISGDRIRKFYTQNVARRNAAAAAYAQQRGIPRTYAPDEIETLARISRAESMGFAPSVTNNDARYVRTMLEDPNLPEQSANSIINSLRSSNGVGQTVGTAADVVGDAAVDAAMSGKGSGLKGFFNNTKANLGTAWSNVKSGKGVMPKYAGIAKGAMGIQAAIQAANAFNEYNNAKGNTDDLISDILASAGSNPNLRYDLSTDQLDTLRRLQNGTYDTTGDFDMSSLLSNLGNIATGAVIGFVTGGGVPGAILGGLSGVIDGVSSGVVGNQEQITADLQGLYAALQEAEMRNKAMKRDAAMQRYANSLY